MTIKGSDAAARVKGWSGLFLSILPFVQLLPIPVLQAIVLPVQEFLNAFGIVGVSLLATSPAVAGKHKP